MTITRDAFLRSLPAAVGGAPFAVAQTAIAQTQCTHLGDQRAWRITVDAMPDLALGLLRLQRYRVRVFLAGYDEMATRGFLDRFELYFRRAGG